MIKVTVFYPNSDGARFDMDYYRDRHMSMVRERLGAACKGIAVEQGLAGPTVDLRKAMFGPGTTLTVRVRQPVMSHTVSVARLRSWL